MWDVCLFTTLLCVRRDREPSKTLPQFISINKRSVGGCAITNVDTARIHPHGTEQKLVNYTIS